MSVATRSMVWNNIENFLSLLKRSCLPKVLVTTEHCVNEPFIQVTRQLVVMKRTSYGINLIWNSTFELNFSKFRPSIAATAVSQCLYYIGNDDDAMEKVCNMSPQILHRVCL